LAETDLSAADVLRLLDGARAIAVARCDECKRFGFAWWDGKDKVFHARVSFEEPLSVEENDAGYIVDLEDHEEVVDSLRNELFSEICLGGHDDPAPSV
jgi:hypothetical protein